MPARLPDDVVVDARAAFDRGDRRAAWEALRLHARRHPQHRGLRLTLVETYRAAGHPDQAARWGASMPEALTDHERVLLVRVARRSTGPEELRGYLGLAEVPPALVELLPDAKERRRRAGERWASELLFAAGVVGTLGAFGVAIGIVVTLVQAFVGGRAQEPAQWTAWAGLGAVAFVGTVLVGAAAVRQQWVRAVLLVVLVGATVVALAVSDPTTTLPFGSP